ncbi:MAG: hemerythrin domain-containing protein [Armatimonadetes bacterium]|nr:hemerythrin domain-containing protein [Armatimonadota bacterium]
MKRHESLRELSQEHHLGLVEARALRRAAAAEPQAAAAAARRFLSFSERALTSHFRTEEEVLLPYWSRHVPADDPLLARTLVEHVRLRRAALEIGGQLDRGEDVRGELGRAGELLHDHIRFEERELFPAVEQALDEAELLAIAARRSGDGPRCAAGAPPPRSPA